MRPNPGIGFPGYVDYLPVTRGTPKPPSIRHPGGPAPGPVPERWIAPVALWSRDVRAGRDPAVPRAAAGASTGQAA